MSQDLPAGGQLRAPIPVPGPMFEIDDLVDPAPKMASEIGKSAAQVDAERNAERSAPRREKTSERLAGESEVEVVVGSNPYLPEGYADKVMAALAEGKGWKGTPPAEGTRRKLILDTLLKTGLSVQPGPRTALRFADDLESALLKATIAEEEADDALEADAQEAIANVVETLDQLDAPQAPTAAQRIQRLYREMKERIEQAIYSVRSKDRPEGQVPEGTRELHIVLASQEGTPAPLFVELENQDGAGVGGFERRDADPLSELSRIVIPYGRDDRWAQLLTMAAVIAGQESDVPFPAGAVDDVLREFGVQPTFPRTWPHRTTCSDRAATVDAPITKLPDEAVELIVDRAAELVDELREKGVDLEKPVEPDGFKGAFECMVDPDGVPYISLASLTTILTDLAGDLAETHARREAEEELPVETLEEAEEAEELDEPATEVLLGGRASGKSEAMRARIIADAASPADAEGAIRELEETGRAFMLDGRHVPPVDPPQGEIRYDEEPEDEIDDDRPIWKIELDRAINHIKNAVSSWSQH